SVLCVNQSMSVDFSATDPDGDSLVYALCPPYNGATSLNPYPYPPLDYSELTYVAPYSAQNPIGGNPSMSINSSTGTISGTPDAIGTYVVGVCVSEYRNGILLSEHRGDYVFNVADCNELVYATLSPDIFSCDDAEVDFANGSIGNSFHWDFGVPGIYDDTSDIVSPVYTYPDTGVYIATLIAYSSDSCSDTASTTVHVYPSLITINFSPLTGIVIQPVHFIGVSTTSLGTIHSWWWNFGDGHYSSFQNPTHAYIYPGTYDVTLQVTTSFGCIKDTTIEVIISGLTGIANTLADGDNKIQKILLINLLGEAQSLTNTQLTEAELTSFESRLKPGVYVLEVFTEQGIITRKIIAQQ
ncbi:MAG: PKD domain-containing protein, partial [Chitinophagales bacterium]